MASSRDLLGTAGSGKIGPKEELAEEEAIEVQKASWSHKIELLRLKTKKFFAANIAGIFYNEALLYLSVFSTCQFVYSTYEGESDLLDSIEVALAVVFGFDWMLSLFLADHKMEFVTSFFSMVDLLTVVPIWVTRTRAPISFPDVHTADDVFTYVLFGLSTTRVLRALRLHRRLSENHDEVKRTLGTMALIIVSMLMFNAAVMQYLDGHMQPLPYHTWLYFAWIETATVGYGDINPLSEQARLAVMFFIGLSLVVVPKLSNELMDKLALYSIYQRLWYVPKPRSKHVLICGDLTSTSLLEFFQELFHEDHDVGNMVALVLQPTPPSPAMREIMSHPEFLLNVVYIEGTALNEVDLQRCCADTAVGVFILANKFATNVDTEDTITILKNFSIKRYCHIHNIFSQPFFCLQLIRPENQRHLETESGGASVFTDTDNDSNIIVCVNEVKMGVIAKSATFPGSNTLIMNLLTSFADDEEEGGEGAEDEEEDDDVGNWIDEYHRGCDWEIYTSELAESFSGQRFCDLSAKLYSLYGVLLFGLHVRDTSGKVPSRILINPKDYYIPYKHHFELEGILLAKNKASSDMSFKDSEQNQSQSADDMSQLVLRQLQLSQGNNAMFASGSTTRIGDNTSSPGNSEARLGSSGHGIKGKGHLLSWQQLMRKYDSDKNSNESQQEKLTLQQDLYLKANFYVRERSSLNDCTIRTSVFDELPHLSNHVIILGKGVNNLYDLIRPLRAKSLGALRPIVILNHIDLPHSVWERICIFEAIFFLRGSALEEGDLRRAGIFRASRVIVLATAMEEGTEINEVGALVDSDAIFAYQAVKRLNERAHCVVEIVKHTSIAYINSDNDTPATDNGKDDGYRFTPQFAGGVLFISSMIDTLAVQTFYNPLIGKVLAQLVGNLDHEQEVSDAEAAKPASPVSPGEEIDSDARLAGESEQERKRYRQNGRKHGLAGVKSSTLCQIPIPEGLESRTYGALFRFLAKTGVIPVGLFRGVFPQMKVGSKNNKMSYVYTNPPRDTELFSCDKVFVLSCTPTGKMSAKESADAILMENSLKQRALTTVEASANALREDFFLLIDSQTQMHDHIASMRSSIFETIDQTSVAVRDLQKGYELEVQNMAAVAGRGRFGSVNMSPTRERLGSTQGRKAESIFKGNSDALEAARRKHFEKMNGAMNRKGSHDSNSEDDYGGDISRRARTPVGRSRFASADSTPISSPVTSMSRNPNRFGTPPPTVAVRSRLGSTGSSNSNSSPSLSRDARKRADDYIPSSVSVGRVRTTPS
jgi:voltage-gated potassium channel Kch